MLKGRFKSTLVDSERYFLTISRYIELNPVRANMVGHPAEYPWSSYQKNAVGKPISLITPHPCYLALGKTDNKRQLAYRALFDETISPQTLEEIRDALNKAWVLGDDRFKQQIEKETGRRVSPIKRGGDRKSEVYREGFKYL